MGRTTDALCAPPFGESSRSADATPSITETGSAMRLPKMVHCLPSFLGMPRDGQSPLPEIIAQAYIWPLPSSAARTGSGRGQAGFAHSQVTRPAHEPFDVGVEPRCEVTEKRGAHDQGIPGVERAYKHAAAIGPLALQQQEPASMDRRAIQPPRPAAIQLSHVVGGQR